MKNYHVLEVVLLLACIVAPLRADSRPSILFGSRSGAAYGYVDLGYLRQLRDRGFEVDYTRTLGRIVPETGIRER